MVVFWRLGYLPLLDPDEAHYAEITREMMRARDLVVPLLNGEPHIDKPVLFHWLQAGSFRILGQTEFAARLPSALSALLLFWVTYWCGSRLFRRDTGEHGALLLATIPATFALVVRRHLRHAVHAVPVRGADRAVRERRRSQAVAGVRRLPADRRGGADQGPGGDDPDGGHRGDLPAPSRVARRRRCGCTGDAGIAIVLVVAAPWFLLMWQRFGDRFIDQYVLYNNLSLFGRPLYRTSRYPLFYGRVFLTAFLPWSPLVLARIVDIVRSRTPIRNLSLGEFVLTAWTITIVGFFSLSWFKLDTYIFPAAPAVCLLAANAWRRAVERRRAAIRLCGPCSSRCRSRWPWPASGSGSSCSASTCRFPATRSFCRCR